MPTNPVLLIDTSVFLNLLEVPGRCDHAVEAKAEFERLRRAGAKFLIPVTTLIETGNFIAQVRGDRASAAARFLRAVEAARQDNPPWTVRGVSWDAAFLEDLLGGDSTGSTLEQLMSSGTFGVGDVAILIERDRFRAGTAYTDVRIWTFDQHLAAYT